MLYGNACGIKLYSLAVMSKRTAILQLGWAFTVAFLRSIKLPDQCFLKVICGVCLNVGIVQLWYIGARLSLLCVQNNK